MGDHRANISITFEIHGKTYKSSDWWINYWPDEETGVDRRVTDWFRACWDDAYARYQQRRFEQEWESRERAEREQELAELVRLKAKYEPGNTPNCPG